VASFPSVAAPAIAWLGRQKSTSYFNRQQVMSEAVIAACMLVAVST